MKCIKMNKDGKIVRVSEQEADHLAADSKGIFVPKSEWKKQNKPVEAA